MTTIRIAIAQFNAAVGDIDGNAARVSELMTEADAACADLCLFPELALTGYPPEDLLLKPHFVADNLAALEQVAKSSPRTIAIIGFVDQDARGLFNAAAVVNQGRIHDVYHKQCLPNYGVFDEQRYFRAGAAPRLVRVGEVLVGLSICEDIWSEGPPKALAEAGATLLANINSSPYHVGKRGERQELLAGTASSNGVAVAYANLTGGQDELVFDGGSMIIGTDGKLLATAAQFDEDLMITDVEIPRGRAGRAAVELEQPYAGKPDAREPKINPAPGREEEIYGALVMGIQDYARKNSFSRTLIGISGGIDSALTACVAVDALGSDAVTGAFMPSVYTSDESHRFAAKLAENLGLDMITMPIDSLFRAYKDELKEVFKGVSEDETEENIQARIRGNLLMALSNKFGYLLLPTGNKSELSVGYATLYGDMAGGFGILKDVPKTTVYELARFRNRRDPAIPKGIFTKEPSAELRPGQKDSDNLPTYDVLDPILEAYVQDDKSVEGMIAAGFDEEDVRGVVRLVDRNEYKRRQAAPGIKITPKAFGRDRRMPITNLYGNQRGPRSRDR